jgi:hypothetical protein
VSTAKPADIRFYFDQDILGLAHVIAGLRADSTYPGDAGAVIKRRRRPACPVTPGTKDTVWIPQVTGLGWLIITRDSRIQAHKAEIAAVRDSSAKLVALSGEDARGTWAQLEIVMQRWRAIEQLREQPGPFIYTATRTSLKKVPLQ